MNELSTLLEKIMKELQKESAISEGPPGSKSRVPYSNKFQNLDTKKGVLPGPPPAPRGAGFKPLNKMQKAKQIAQHPMAWWKTKQWNKQNQQRSATQNPVTPQATPIQQRPAIQNPAGARAAARKLATMRYSGDQPDDHGWRPQSLSIPSLSSLARDTGIETGDGASQAQAPVQPKLAPKPHFPGMPDLPDFEPQAAAGPENTPATHAANAPEPPNPGFEDDDIKQAQGGETIRQPVAASAPTAAKAQKGRRRAPKASAEVDPSTLGTPLPEPETEVPMASAPGPAKEKPVRSEPAVSVGSASPPLPPGVVGKDLPLPSFSSIVKPKLQGGIGAELGDPKWKVGDVVNIGTAGGGFKVTNKTGSWYNLERGGDRYVFPPFQGLRKVR